MIIDDETNAVFISALLKDHYPQFHQSLSSILKAECIPLTELEHTKDIWCRDYMPVQVSDEKFVQFKYNPDYLKPKKYRHVRSEQAEIPSPLPLHFTASNLIVDGGNIVRHKSRVIVTNKIFPENKPLEQPAILEKIKTVLSVDEIIVIPKVPGDFTGHSDGMVRFINHNTVLLNDFRKFNETYFEKLKKSLTRNGLNITLLPWEGWKNKTDKEDTGDYVNFLHVGDLIVVPEFDSGTDDLAKQVIRYCYPNAKIKVIDCRSIGLEGGLLNCCTWNIKAKLN